jgi:uncharacterized repeat protein (TIGR01451 family)
MKLHDKQRESRHVRLRIPLLLTAVVLTSLVQLLAPNAAAAPLLSLSIGLSALDVEPGEEFVCRIFFNNTGGNITPFAWINVSVPLHMNYTYDNSSLEGGVKTGDYNWTFTNVIVSDHQFDINFTVTPDALDGELMTILANVDYLDDLGKPMPSNNTSATVTARRPIMSLTKGAQAFNITPGQTFNYTVSFQNVGSRRASTVFVNDTLPSSLIYLSDSSASIGGTMVSLMNWSFSDVVGPLSFDITVQARSNLLDGSLIVNDATLYYSNSFGVWFPETTALNTTRAIMPNVTLQKMVDKSVAYAGEFLNYTLTVSNAGLGSARMVWINDTLPTWTTYVSSTPACVSVIGNTCMWNMSNLLPGSIQFRLQAMINVSVPEGSTLLNNATLNYTSRLGVLLGNLSANAATFIPLTLEYYLELILEDRTPTSTPNDIFEFDILIRNPYPFSSLAAWLNISFPGDLEYVSDNVTDIGGSKTSNYRWEFANVARGNRSFTIVTRVDPETTDNQQLRLNIQLDHTNEIGVGFPTISDMITVTIRSPTISSEITSNERTYEKGDTLTFNVFFNNTGSDSASRVWVDLSAPSSVRYLYDTSAFEGGTSTGDLSYRFSDVSPGDHQFMIYFSFDGATGQSTDVEIWAFLNYTDSNGDLVGESARSASCIVTTPSEGFPLWLVVVAAVVICAISFAGASTRESVKYSLLIFFIPLYSRLRRKEVLDHETRGMIRGYVIANPGDHFNSIKSALDLRNGTLAHHLSILERENIIKSVKDGKYRRFFPVGMRVPDKAYPTKIEILIINIVKESPGITQKEIAGHLKMTQPTVSYHINKLKESGKVRTEKHGMSLRHFIDDSEE